MTGGSTMKAASKLMLATAMMFALVLVVRAEDKEEKEKPKEVELKGTLACAKCVFKVKGIKKCTTAIQVKDKDDKEVIYLFIDKGNKETYHKPICTKKKKGSVKGIVSKKDGQMWITPTKDSVKFDDD